MMAERTCVLVQGFDLKQLKVHSRGKVGGLSLRSAGHLLCGVLDGYGRGGP